MTLIEVQEALGNRPLSVSRCCPSGRFDRVWCAESEGHFAVSTTLEGAVRTLVQGIQRKVNDDS